MDVELISRAAAIDALTDTELRRNLDSVYDGDMNRTRRAAQRVIAQMPAVNAVPVIRCRNCEYWNETIEGWGECERLEVIDSNPEIIHAHQTPWDWYCADGERRGSE